MPSKTTKVGTSKASATERRALFVQAYLANGRTASGAPSQVEYGTPRLLAHSTARP